MATPEQTNQTPQERNESTERLLESFGLSAQLNRLRRALGQTNPIENVNERELQTMREQAQNQAVYTSYGDLARTNEIYWRIKAIQHEAALAKGEMTEADTERNRRELIVANQAITYNQYVPAVIEQVHSFMDLYQQEFLELLPFLPEEQREQLREQYRQSVEYLHILKEAINQRHTYASVLELDRQIERITFRLRTERLINAADREELTKRKKGLERSRVSTFNNLSSENQEIITNGRALYERFSTERDPARKRELSEQYRKLHSGRRQQMDATVIEILKGNPEGRQELGIPKDFLPQRLYLQAIQLRYGQLRDVQQQIARRDDWTEQQKRDAQEKLSTMRRSYMENMIVITQQLAGHQQAMAELTSIQNQFGNNFDLTDARNSSSATTPPEVLEAVDKSIDGARDFHIGRLQAMLKQVDTSFNPNGLESMQDAGIMRLLQTVNGLSGTLRNLMTAALPEGPTKKSIDDWLDTSLPLSIQESLDSGVGPDGKPLTREEKLQRIRDVIIRFRDTGAVKKFRTTVDLLQGMPDASKYVGQQVTNPLPPLPEGGIRSTTARDALIEKHGGATAYAMMIAQMKTDGEAFHEAYRTFLHHDMEDLVDIRLRLIAEVDTIKESWKTLATNLSIAVGAGAVLPWVAAGVGGYAGANMLWRGGRALIKTPNAILRGVRAVPSVAGRAAGASGLAYRTYLDFKELGEMSESIERQPTRMIADLRAAGFEPDPADQEEKFRYKDGGTEVAVNIKDIHEAQEGQTNAQALRTMVSAAETLAVLRFGLSRTFWPLMAVEISGETVRYGIDQEADRKFVTKAPAWLLAKINMQEATGDTAYDMLAKASGEMMTDSPFGDAEDSPENKNKKEIREKMLFAILNRELREFPDLHREVYGGSEHPLNLQEFFAESGGFKDVFLPAFYSRLFELSGNGLSWEEISKGQIDGDWNIPLPTAANITLVEIRRSMRETIVFFIQHKREEQYLAALAERDRLQAQVAALANRNTPDAHRVIMRLEILDDMVHTLGETEVFGQRLNQVDIAILQRNEGKTRAQLSAEYLFENADDLVFVVPGSEIPGLPNGFSFGARGSIYKNVSDNVELIGNMNSVLPRTTDEPEGRVYDPIAEFTHHARISANWISKDARLPELAGNASADAARQHITEGSIALSELDERRGRRLSRDRQMEQRLYSNDSNTPVVLRSFNVPRGRNVGNDYPRMESLMNDLRYAPSLRGEQFSSDNVVAVMFEGHILSSGQATVLATYVYGDPTTRDSSSPQFFVVQRAKSTFGTSRGSGTMLGHNRVLGGSNFLRQEGGKAMLEGLDSPLEERRLRTIERRREQLRRTRELGEQRTEMMRQQETMRQTAKRNPGVWHAYPNNYLNQEQGERRHEMVSYYRPEGRQTGYFLYLRKPTVDNPNVPSMRAGPGSRIAETIGDYRTTRTEIVDEATGANFYFNRMRGDYATFFRGRNSSIPEEAVPASLTTPIPNDALGSVRNVLAVFVRNINDGENRSRENTLVSLYEKLESDTQRREFLRRLEWIVRISTRSGDRSLEGEEFNRLVSAHSNLLKANLTEEDWARFRYGDTQCGDCDANGVYTVHENNDSSKSHLSVYTRFSLGSKRWQWSPDNENWFSTSYTNVRYTNGRYYSPRTDHIQLLRRLNA